MSRVSRVKCDMCDCILRVEYWDDYTECDCGNLRIFNFVVRYMHLDSFTQIEPEYEYHDALENS